MAKKKTKKKATKKTSKRGKKTGRGSSIATRPPVSLADKPASDESVMRIFQFFAHTFAAITNAKKKLAERAVVASLTERDYIKAKQLDLTADREKVNAKYLAFLAQQTKVRPPTKAELKKAENTAKLLDGLIANAVQAKAIVTLVTDVLVQFTAATSGSDVEPNGG